MAEVLSKLEDGILKVQLNRAEKLNAFNPKMIQIITKVFKDVSKKNNIRAVVLSGLGASFCAGADLKWMKSMAKFNLKENTADANKLFEMFNSIKQCPVPVICRVQGNVYGGGLGLIAASDIVVAESSSQYCFSEVKLGMVPAVISSFVLNKMHKNKAREMMMTARLFSASQAYEAGLVEFVGRELEMTKYINDTLNLILASGPEATRSVKGFLSKIEKSSPAQVKKLSVDLISKRRVSKEGQEGLKSFLQKRSPKWKKKLSSEDEEEN